ncbi:MAG: flagellar basal body P-ring formation chaperone FlgA [Dokdonella sp.]
MSHTPPSEIPSHRAAVAHDHRELPVRSFATARGRDERRAGFLTRARAVFVRGIVVAASLLVTTTPACATSDPTATEAASNAALSLLRLRPELAGARVEIDLLPFDPRIAIAACHAPLRAELVGRRLAGPRATVRVSCADPQGAWSLAVGARIRAYKPVVVAQVSLARGDTLDAGTTRLAEADVLGSGYGYLDKPEKIAGSRVLRPIPEGSVIPPGALAKPYLVERGQSVTLVSRADSISVRAVGVAIEDGSAGDHVRVRNLSSGHTVGGVVEDRGVVAVGG